MRMLTGNSRLVTRTTSNPFQKKESVSEGLLRLNMNSKTNSEAPLPLKAAMVECCDSSKAERRQQSSPEVE
jgi:hypothetical protein